jgi:Delta3,5-Delta2,4-dienoyl-CoA isomerase
MDLGNAGAEANPDSARASLAMRKWLLEMQHAIGAPARCPVPVIAAVHGSVLGLGVDIIAACDIRFAASSAAFAIKASD